jgi:hypothetical protein
MSEFRENPATAPASSMLSEGQAATTPTAAPAALADCSAAEQAGRHYRSIINPLLSRAYQQGSMETFADVLTWTLARVIANIDKSYVTGDILRRIGNYTCQIATTNRAEAEAAAAKKGGRVPH